MLGLLAFFAIVAVVLAYRFSDAYKSRRSLLLTLRSAEALQARSEQVRASSASNVQQAAAAYTQDVYADRLRAIALEALKERASGLRLQALRDAGIQHLGDLQGWSESRIGQVRGVGPKSAGIIASLVRSMSSDIKLAPVELPDASLSRPRERQLAQAVLVGHDTEALLTSPAQAWTKMVSEKRLAATDLQKNLAFMPWILGLGKGSQLQDAVAAVDKVLIELGDEAPLRKAIEQALAEAQVIANAPHDLASYRQHTERYDAAFAAALRVPMRRQSAAAVPKHVGPAKNDSPPPSPPKESALKQIAQEELTSMTVGEQASTPSGDVAVPAPSPQFARLVKGSVPGLPRAPQSAADILQTFLLAKQAQGRTSGDPQWIPAGTSLVVQGITLERGMIYVGSLKGHGTFVGAIDPGLAIRAGAPEATTTFEYGATYASFSPEQRYSCLQWLAEGAADCSEPAAATLYFQGLEHRLLAADGDEADRAEVLAEVARLAELFRPSQPGPGSHARDLISFSQARLLPGDGAPPLPVATERGYELPFAMRYGLGIFMRDKQPVPLEWMLRWADLAPNVSLRTPATRCRAAFQAAFTHLYQERYGLGLVIPANKTMLKISYSPMDYNLRGPATEWTFQDVPDINAITGPQAKLRDLIEQSTEQIEPYSRFCGRYPGSEDSLQACFLLPRYLWPAAVVAKLEHLRSDFAEPLNVLAFDDWLAQCGEAGGAAGARLAELAVGFEQNLIGLEPDVLGGARRPKATDCIVLFPLTEPAQDRTTAQYRKASLAISLAACVALADGQADQVELEAAERLIAGWIHLHADLRMRLRAQYRVQVSHGAELSALRTKLLALGQDERKEIALDMTRMASADGVVSPAEVKLLESLYRMLGLPGQELYGHLYGGGEARTATSPGRSNGFRLDLAKVQSLQKESAEVSAMLEKLFTPEQDDVAPVVVARPLVSAPSDLLPGLDAAHAALLRILLTRAEWSKAELLAAAAPLNLMLDGALERINDAAFEHLDAAIVEGDDPFFVQADLLEKA